MLDQPAGAGIDEAAWQRGQAGEQGKLGGGVQRVSGAGDEGDEGRRAQADAQRFKADHRCQIEQFGRSDAGLRAAPGQPGETENG